MISYFKQVGFKFTAKCCYIYYRLTLTGSEYHRVGPVTEKALVPTFVLTLGTKSTLELDDQSCLCCLAGVSSECKYCLDESA